VLADLGAGSRGECGESSHEPGRLDRPVRGVHQSAARERAFERRRQVVDPFGVDAILAHRLVLAADLVPLLLVGRQAVAAGPRDRVAAERGHVVERPLGPVPQLACGVAAVGVARDVVARRATAEREAAVAAARAFGDPAGVVHADAEPALRERERRRAAGDAGADDRHVHPAVVGGRGARHGLVLEPVGIHDSSRTVSAAMPILRTITNWSLR
jgi:hypothetical protein